MARVVVAPSAREDLDTLVDRLKLPASAHARVEARLQQLRRFPESGQELTGQWAGLRCILGPWRWMLIVYVYDAETDEVAVVTIQDSRSASAATSRE